MEDRIIEIIEEVSDFSNLKENIDIDLLDNEILDSLAFIQLITALEDEFDIEIYPTQVHPDTWRSVEKIIKMVKEKIE